MMLPGCEIRLSVLDYRLTYSLCALLLVYFLWMDVVLFQIIQSQPPLEPPKPGLNMSRIVPNPYSPFAGLSVKMMMMDQLNHYVETPLATIFNAMTGFSKNYLWVTPNMISCCGMFFAFAAGRCVSYDHSSLHFLSIILMLVRGWMDALDGLVARDRIGIVQHISLRNTSGYVIDAIADTLGYTVFLFGCFVFLKRHVNRLKLCQPLESVLAFDAFDPRLNYSKPGLNWSSQRIFLVVFCFGLQIAASAVLWDHYCDVYHDLLDSPRNSRVQAIVQNEVLRSKIMWILIWLWKVSNSHALMNTFLAAVFINKMWEFLVWIQLLGFVEIFFLFIFTEIHFHDVQSYIETVH